MLEQCCNYWKQCCDSERRFLAQHIVAMLEQCCDYSKQCCDSQRRFLAQHIVAMLEQCCNYSKQCRNIVARLSQRYNNVAVRNDDF